MKCWRQDISAKRFTVMYTRRCYISLAAYTAHVDGGLVVVKNGQTTLLNLSEK